MTVASLDRQEHRECANSKRLRQRAVRDASPRLSPRGPFAQGPHSLRCQGARVHYMHWRNVGSEAMDRPLDRPTQLRTTNLEGAKARRGRRQGGNDRGEDKARKRVSRVQVQAARAADAPERRGVEKEDRQLKGDGAYAHPQAAHANLIEHRSKYGERTPLKDPMRNALALRTPENRKRRSPEPRSRCDL